MPTNESFSDAYLNRRDQPGGGRRPRGPSRWKIGAALLLVVAASFGATDLVSHLGSHDAVHQATQPPGLEQAPPPAPAETTASRQPPVVEAPGSGSHVVFVTATSVPGAGRSTQLTVTADHSSVAIRSTSPMSVSVSVNDGYGKALRHWTDLASGQSDIKTMVTGTQYGYCFSQAAGSGYASVRGCGLLTMHQYLNGVEAPDGSSVEVNFSFAGS
jgi:hypothetical protein